MRTAVPEGMGASLGRGAKGIDALTVVVSHEECSTKSRSWQTRRVRGGKVNLEQANEQSIEINAEDDVEALLVEEVSIDGLCGVY